MGPVWTPIDASGAGLTFTSASGTYMERDGFVIASGTVTYPATADTSNAAIGGFPVAAGAPQAAPCGGLGTVWLQMQAGTTTAFVWLNSAQGTRKTNNGMTAAINFTIIYPASP